MRLELSGCAGHLRLHACQDLHGGLNSLDRRDQTRILHLVVHTLHVHLLLYSCERLKGNVEVCIRVLCRSQDLIGLVKVIEDLEDVLIRKHTR